MSDLNPFKIDDELVDPPQYDSIHLSTLSTFSSSRPDVQVVESEPVQHEIPLTPAYDNAFGNTDMSSKAIRRSTFVCIIGLLATWMSMITIATTSRQIIGNGCENSTYMRAYTHSPQEDASLHLKMFAILTAVHATYFSICLLAYIWNQTWGLAILWVNIFILIQAIFEIGLVMDMTGFHDADANFCSEQNTSYKVMMWMCMSYFIVNAFILGFEVLYLVYHLCKWCLQKCIHYANPF